MGGSGCNFNELVKFRENLNKLNEEQVNVFMESCAKELAARLLALVKPRTPVGQYPKSTGKHGGTLRRGWTGGKTANPVAYANSLKVNHFGNVYVIEVINPTEYASYVEFGHRTPNGAGWVEGKFMLTISEQELESALPAILEKKLKKFMGECFK